MCAKKAAKKKAKKAPAKKKSPKRELARRKAGSPETVPARRSGLFPPEEIDRLRLSVLTSARQEDKLESLRKLAFAPLDDAAKTEVFLGRLADPDAKVRAEAAQLLRGMGLDPEIAGAIGDFEREEEGSRRYAIDRLSRRISKGSALDIGAALIALACRLRIEDSPLIRRAVVDLLADAADVIAGSPERAEELVRLIVWLHATHPAETSGAGRRLVKGLGARLPFLRGVLWDEFDATGEHRVRVFVLRLLSELPEPLQDERLPAEVAGEIIRADATHMSFRALADLLAGLLDAGARALLRAFPRAGSAQQKHLIPVLDDICRYRKVSSEVKAEVADLFVEMLGLGSKEIDLAVLSTQLPANSDLADSVREKLVEQFLSRVHMFGFPSDIDNCENTIARSGLAAIRPLLDRLSASMPPDERTRSARILGTLALEEAERRSLRRDAWKSKEHADLREKLLEVLRTLQRWSLDDSFPGRIELFTAIGKVASGPAIPPDTVELVTRNLFERRERPEIGHRVLEGLGYLAASMHVDAERSRTVEGIFREQLSSEMPEVSSESRDSEGVTVFTIGEEANLYIEAVPAAVMGLAHIALGTRTDSARAGSIVDYLLEKWQGVVSGELEWGPPGSGALIEAFRRIASSPRIDIAHKVRIVRAMVKRATTLSVLRALGDIFESEDRSVDMGRLAAAVGVGLLRKRRDERSDFRNEEQEALALTLGRIARRATLDVTTDLTRRLREDVAEMLFEALRDNISGAYDQLARMRASQAVPEELRDKISRRLAPHERLDAPVA